MINQNDKPTQFSIKGTTGVLHKSDDTVGPQKPLTVVDFCDEEAPALTIPFLIYKKGRVTQIDVDEEESIIHIGKSDENEIVIDDPAISDVQVSIVKLGDKIYFMDCGTRDLVTFNGVKRRQAVIPVNSKMIIKIGLIWIIYNADVKARLTQVEGVSECLIKYDTQESSTDKEPVLIGSHPSCDLVIGDEQVHPFHALVFYSHNGVFIEDLSHGRPGIKVNGMNSIGVRPVNEDSEVAVGGKKSFFVYVYGKVKEHCETMYPNFNPAPTLAFTNLKMNLPPVAIPKTNEKLSIGREDSCNIIIPDPSVSRLHAFIMIKDKCLYLADNNSHNHTFVNRRIVTKTAVRPGDIIEFGDTPFLIHYA